MQLSELYQDVPDGWFSFSRIKVKRVRHHGLDFEQAVVAWERIGDLICGEGIDGKTSFKRQPRKGGRKVRLRSAWEFRRGCALLGVKDGGYPLPLPGLCR